MDKSMKGQHECESGRQREQDDKTKTIVVAVVVFE